MLLWMLLLSRRDHAADGGDGEGREGVDDEIGHRVAEGGGTDEGEARRRGMLLHIQAEEGVEGKFVDFPQHADHDGEGKGEQRDEKGRKRNLDLLLTVQKIDEDKSECAEHCARKGVEHRIPMRDAVIEGEDLAEKDGAIEKDKIKDNNGIGEDDTPSLFDECGEGHDHKTEQALDEDEDVVGFEAYAFFVRGRRGGGDDTHGGVKN